ncbi:hypothetical protein [Paraburkholderia lacunae]|uniref:Uncharacterized protein n=1 Tax=Paraburkholderia lacunae TaxID=2211104 RepID=A0A370NGA3_9BURK|nr:hypothetical protein [Paraburkholderia lacunae]RDK04603.1 hypothetical protein DLM46_01665 [Paraburkholderia lacunae]
MKKLIIGLLLAAGVTAANAHVIGTITDGSERVTLTDKRSCDGCEYEASTTASGMNASWNYTDIDGIIEVDESDGVHPAETRKYNLGKDVHLTTFGKKFAGPAND